MRFLKVMKEDIKRAFYNNKYRFLIAFLLILALALIPTNICNAIHRMQPELGKMNFIDYIFYFTCGLEPVNPEELDEIVIPFAWITIQFLCCFVTLDYVHSDQKSVGRDILLRTKSRMQWWISKCVCITLMIMAVYFIMYMISGVVSSVNYDMAGGLHFNLLKGICVLKNKYTYSIEMSVFLLVVPMLFSVCISLFQMAISQFTGPIMSILIILSVDFLTIFSNNKFLWPNWSMILRSDVCIENGIGFSTAVVAVLIMGLLGAVAGGVRFYKKDIL